MQSNHQTKRTSDETERKKMKLPTYGDWIPAGVMCGVLTVCAGGWATHAHAQSPEIPVKRIEDIGALSKFALTFRMIVAPAVRDEIGSLYAYDPTAPGIDGLEVRPETIGDVATIGPCSDASEEARWCARYFDQMDKGEALLAAYQTAYREMADRSHDATDSSTSNQSSDQPTTYFATTYPLPDVEPAQRFVSGLSP